MLWRPDTCDCEFEFTGALTDYAPTRVVKCSHHADMGDVDAFRHAHQAINVMKNRWHAAVDPARAEDAPTPMRDDAEARAVVGSYKGAMFYSIDASRRLVVVTPNLTLQERRAAERALADDPIVQQVEQGFPGVVIEAP